MASGSSLVMPTFREVERVLTAQPTLEGGGVSINRAFAETNLLDPFLLLDEFHSHDPVDYSAGFPWHPHRGFETVTYMIEGSIEHQDSAGYQGTIGAGGVQWMTAGGGVIHQEMPKGDSQGRLWGLQLWVNLPAACKMMKPKYRGITKDQIPEVQITPDVLVKVVSGNVQGNIGPIHEIAVDCQFFDISVKPKGSFEYYMPKDHRVFAYILEGQGAFEARKANYIDAGHTVVYGKGEGVLIQAGNENLRCLLVSGQPIGEPVAWNGSIVMNSPSELDAAFRELVRGDFTKSNED